MVAPRTVTGTATFVVPGTPPLEYFLTQRGTTIAGAKPLAEMLHRLIFGGELPGEFIRMVSWGAPTSKVKKAFWTALKAAYVIEYGEEWKQYFPWGYYGWVWQAGTPSWKPWQFETFGRHVPAWMIERGEAPWRIVPVEGEEVGAWSMEQATQRAIRERVRGVIVIPSGRALSVDYSVEQLVEGNVEDRLRDAQGTEIQT